MADSSVGIVAGIAVVSRPGLYAPFTMSGSLVVNGVVVSSYIALQESEMLVIGVGGWSIPLTLQWLAYVFESPHRMVCRAGLCPSETYTADGISQWVYWPLLFSEWIVHYGLTWLVVPLLVLFLPFWVVEMCLLHMTAVVASATANCGWIAASTAFVAAALVVVVLMNEKVGFKTRIK